MDIITYNKVMNVEKKVKSLNGATAPTFLPTEYYPSGSIVLYNDDLYEFTTNHSAGAWNSKHVKKINMASNIGVINSSFVASNVEIMPVTVLDNIGTYVPSNGSYPLNKLDVAAATQTSVYSIGQYQEITITSISASSCLFLVSNDLYTESDVPIPYMTGVRTDDTNSITYKNTSGYKFLYIISKNTTKGYKVVLTVNGYNSVVDIENGIYPKPISVLRNVDIYTPSSGMAHNAQIVAQAGAVLNVYDISKYDKVVVSRPYSSVVAYIVSNVLYKETDIPVANLDQIKVNGNVYRFDNEKKYRYLYLTVFRNSLSLYTAHVGIDIPEYINKIQENVIDYDISNIPTNIVCTYKNMYVANTNGILYYSNDNCKTWTKRLDIKTYGLIKTYHLFDNGCIAFFTHQNAYYSENWETVNEATVYESDGQTIYVPSQYDNFTTTKEYKDRKYVNGQDLYVFGNYGIKDENNTRRNIYASFDNGHTYKVIYEFNISGNVQIRHIHTVVYNPNYDKFLCLTGDFNTQSNVIEFSIVNDSISNFSILGTGAKYKWAGIGWYGDKVYYCLDQTPGAVLETAYADISDTTKHNTILDNLPNDCIGLFVGDRGDLLVTISKYRSTGQSNSPFSIYVDCLNIYYSENRRDFKMIHTDNITNTNGQIYYGFYGVNSDGRILSGVWAGNVDLDAWNKLPSVDLAYIVKKAGFPNAFKPYNPSYEVTPVTAISCQNISVGVGDSVTPDVLVFPYDANVKTWSITSYDPSHISVNGAVITGVSAGTTEIIIRSNSNYNVKIAVPVTIT